MKPPKGEKLEIDIEEPERGDVTALCDLLMQNFGYIYSALFDTSEKLTSQLMRSILVAHGGKHALGYRSFYIARQRGTRKIVGMLLLKTDSSDKGYGAFVSALTIIKVVLLKLGLGGLFRTWRNWQIIRGVSSKDWQIKVKPNELRIVYLAVSDDARHRRVGKQLLEYAKEVAQEGSKELLSLFVREKNVTAQRFFLSQGFSVEKVIVDDEADDLLERGPSIRMVAKI